MLLAPLLGLVVLIAAQVQAPPPCPAPGEPGDAWRETMFVGLDLKLRLPAELRPLAYSSLGRAARRNRELGIPRSIPDSRTLVAAWEGQERETMEIHRLYLYQVDSGATVRSRGCALAITGRSAIVSRHVISGADRGRDQHWTEAAWPGFVLVAQGVSVSAYVSALRILGTISSIR